MPVVGEKCRVRLGAWWLLKPILRTNLIQKFKLVDRDFNFIFKPIIFFWPIRCGTVLTYELLTISPSIVSILESFCYSTTLNFTLTLLSLDPKSGLWYHLLGRNIMLPRGPDVSPQQGHSDKRRWIVEDETNIMWKNISCCIKKAVKKFLMNLNIKITIQR